MKRAVSLAVVVSLLLSASLLAVDGRKALYMGGTVPGLLEKTEGRFDHSNDDHLIFTPDKKGTAAVAIQWAAVTELEYGQHAGRRVAVGILISPWALFSKKRKHFLTITYKDPAGKEQAAVFELGKDIIRTAAKVLETRTGKDIIYQDDEARKELGGGKGK
jgi:hypothetical protein